MKKKALGDKELLSRQRTVSFDPDSEAIVVQETESSMMMKQSAKFGKLMSTQEDENLSKDETAEDKISHLFGVQKVKS